MKCDIIVNCSPSLGILDQWLPILVEIKKDNPKIKIIFYAPQPEVLYHLNSKMQSSVLIRISNDIFNRVSFTSDSGRILYANSFNDAKKLYDKAFFIQ